MDDGIDALNPPLAPLASSETFSDLVMLNSDVQENRDNKIPSNNNEDDRLSQEAKHEKVKNDFDSLELLFDFPSSEISSDIHLNVEQSSKSIRFPENHKTLNAENV